MKPLVYLDHNASSFPTPDHWHALGERLYEGPVANASSPHSAGRRTQNLLSVARRAVAQSLGVPPAEVIFVSSATEANNTIVAGLAHGPGHAVAGSMEHPSVREPLKLFWDAPELSRSTDWVTPQKSGLSDLELACAFVSSLRPDTKLCALMSANNETGQCFPVKLIGDFLQHRRYPESQTMPSHNPLLGLDTLHTLNAALDSRVTQGDLRALHFHVDGTQSYGKTPALHWVSPGIDSLALSGHKVGALGGGAALVVRRGRTAAVRPLLFGGGQERFRRPGTENIGALVSLGMKAEEILTQSHWEKMEKVRDLATRLEGWLRQNTSTRVLSNAAQGLPNTVHFVAGKTRAGIEGEDLVIELDLEGIAASSGSACSSGTNRPSHVALALGCSPEEAKNCVRFSLGYGNTDGELKQVIGALGRIFRIDSGL